MKQKTNKIGQHHGNQNTQKKQHQEIDPFTQWIERAAQIFQLHLAPCERVDVLPRSLHHRQPLPRQFTPQFFHEFIVPETAMKSSFNHKIKIKVLIV